MVGSMLHTMFSGRYDTKPSKDGSYFIDRDGTYFRYILNYLRTGQFIVPQDRAVCREILAEAEFYQVEDMIYELRAGSLQYSSILSSDQCGTLISWLRDTWNQRKGNLFPCLLYRASLNGWSADYFHGRCDNKGATVVVVKTGNYIFGGCTVRSWGGMYFWRLYRAIVGR